MRQMIVAVVAGLAIAAPATAQTPACIDAYNTNWKLAIAGYTSDKFDEAQGKIDLIIAACGEERPSYHPRVMAAELALKRKDAAAAANFLAPVPQPGPKPIGAYSSWLAMKAYTLLKDDAKLTDTRDRLVAAVDAALTAPGNAAKAQKVESWETPDARVTAYSLDLTQGVFLRRYYFLIVPKAALPPTSIMVTNDLMIADLEKNRKAPLAVDAYQCGMHSTLDWLDGDKPGRDSNVSYATAKASVTKALSGQGRVVSSLDAGGDGCGFADFITPLP